MLAEPAPGSSSLDSPAPLLGNPPWVPDLFEDENEGPTSYSEISSTSTNPLVMREVSSTAAESGTLGKGRFLSIDKSGGFLTNPASFNGYTYALSNPLKFVDPSGETPWLAVGVVFGAGALQGGFRAVEYGLSESNPEPLGYLGEFVTGFTGGAAGALAAIAAAPLGPFASGAAGGASDNLVVQLVEIDSKQRDTLSGVDLVGSTIAGSLSVAAGPVIIPKHSAGGRIPKYFRNRKLWELFSSRRPRVQEVFTRDLATVFHGYGLAGSLAAFRDYGGWFTHPFGPGYINFQLFLNAVPHRGSVTVSTCYGSYPQCYPR